LQRASIFWHGSGFCEDAEHHPDRFEHFGISVVEAMSAGVVPVVYEIGGPASVVDAPHAGRTYATLEELADHTVALAADPTGLAGLAAAARARAQEFSYERFDTHLHEVVDRMLASR
jgi:glycosyltransferase involved in cell wall biosynthesis